PLIKELVKRDALPSIASAEVPHSRNHVKSPWTQDTSTEDAPSGRGFKGITEGRGVIMNKLNEDADPNEAFPDDRFDNDHSYI
ncbi:hypothetical protein Tco_1341289, partial [Tanacetum coccineum]